MTKLAFIPQNDPQIAQIYTDFFDSGQLSICGNLWMIELTGFLFLLKKRARLVRMQTASQQLNATVQILGIRFFNGNVEEAIASMFKHGGFLVAPSGTCFARLREDASYRRALLAADMAIADSGLMVVLWRLLRRENIRRISGLKYLNHLLGALKGKGNREIFWVLASERAQQKLHDWSCTERFPIDSENCYVAPRYGSEVEDQNLLAAIEQNRPANVIIAIGSAAQEKLGFYLRENLSYRPAILCTGAALGFITGDQVAIPDWADRFYLGWLFRLMAQPHDFLPRLIRGFELPWLIWKYAENLPPLQNKRANDTSTT